MLDQADGSRPRRSQRRNSGRRCRIGIVPFVAGMRATPPWGGRTAEESIMTATYTFDVFSTVDGFGSYTSSGDWGGYWGKQGPEFLDRRLAQYSQAQRLVLGATTF